MDRLRTRFQLNPHVGNVRGNAELICQARMEAARLGADLLLTPEFFLGGSPVEDLALDPGFTADAAAAIQALAIETADGGPALVVGGPWVEGGLRHNALFVLDGGRITARRAQHEVPAGSVFAPGPAPGPVAFRGWRLGLMIGEDWHAPAVAETLAESGAEMLITLDAAPFVGGGAERRIDLAVARVVETGLGFLRLGQVGGQDDRVFDGAGFVLNPDRSLAVHLPLFEPVVALTEWRREKGRPVCVPQPLPRPMPWQDQAWRALVLGLRDHVAKNGFPGVILGLSGGIGSALSAAIAVAALGPDRVRAVLLPGPASSPERLEDAARCAAALGIRTETMGIGPAMAAFGTMLPPAAGEVPRSGIRGLVLRALADASGDLLLATSDRSALSVGCGGYAVLKDLYRTQVAELARWRNAHGPAVLPERMIDAALVPADATLPAYPVLDAILAGLAEPGQGAAALVAAGQDRATVLRVWRWLDRAGYNRRRAPPGPRIGPHPPGRDRRIPITNGYTGLIP